MAFNPLATEVLQALGRPGRAQLDLLGMLALQTIVVLVFWPREELVTVLEARSPPLTLTALVITMGMTSAYTALRAGAEEMLLPGQRGLRDWALASPLSLGTVVCGYVYGELLQSLHAMALAAPLLLMAFTVSGGEWIALGWCLLAVLVQALFYRLCGAAVHLVLGRHPGASRGPVRTLLVTMFLPVGLVFPLTSHIATVSHALGEGAFMTAAFPIGVEPQAFVAFYAGLAVLVLVALCAGLAQMRRRAGVGAGGSDGAVMR